LHNYRQIINEKVEAAGGKIEASVCQDVVRRLAYPIKDYEKSYICESAFTIEPASIKTLSDGLKSEVDIMRYIIELKRPMKIRVKPSRSSTAEKLQKTDSPTSAQTPEQFPRLSTEETQKDVGQVQEKREKISMEEIDKKLDEIIKNI